MKKIPDWVAEGEGTATVMFDGITCVIEESVLCSPAQTPVSLEDPENGAYKEAWERRLGPDGVTNLPDGTYELVGPKIRSNPYNLEEHQFWPHGVTFRQYSPDIDIEPPRDYDGLREWFEAWENVEGIVWRHPDGRTAKLKRKDFGLPWPTRTHE